MARAAWTGTLGFGLVNIGVTLELAVRPRSVHFHLLHDADGGRIREKHICEKDGADVPYEHIVKGYEVSKNKYVMVTREELKAVNPARDRTIAVEAFFDLGAVDPVYFDRTYYVLPHGKGAARAYTLFAAALEKKKRVALGRVVMSTQQHLCIVHAKESLLRLTTMAFGDEVVTAPDAPRAEHSPKELQMAEAIIGQLDTPFRPERYRDDHRTRVLTLLKQKASGRTMKTVEPEAPPEITDLAEALQRSLDSARSAAHPMSRAAGPRSSRRSAIASRSGRPAARRRR